MPLMQTFLDELCAFHQEYNQQNNTAFTGDMGAFNFIIRTRYNDSFYAGEPVNTVFKKYENNRSDCWFSHK